MKKLLKVALVAICILSMGSFARAQSKIGYIAMNDLITAMPELKTVNTQMDAYKKTFMDAITSQQAEIQKAGADYQSKRATMSDAVRIAKEAELNDMNKRLQDYSNTAQQQVEAKGQEYMKPLYDKANTAITAVAKEKGYTYILDSTQTSLLVKPDGDDIMAAVKLKLALK